MNDITTATAANDSVSDGPLYRVFVYGSLLTDLHNNFCLTDAGGKLDDGDATTQATFSMYDLGSFPACVPNDADGDQVSGECWLVTKRGLERLDRLEGYVGPGVGLYDRIVVTLTSGAQAIMYVMHRARGSRGLVPGGNWKAHLEPAPDHDHAHDCPECADEGGYFLTNPHNDEDVEWMDCPRCY